MIEKLKKIYHFTLAWLGDVLYGHPSQSMRVIGITGTKGKSTSVELLAAILEAAGEKVALVSSVHIKVGRTIDRNQTGNSMPGRFFIQKFLNRAQKANCTVAILEVTSQGIVQYRHRFIDFDMAAFTGIHPEHIESHGSFENYKNAKKQFFIDIVKGSVKRDKQFFVNGSSEYAQEFAAAAGGQKVVLYSRENFINRYLGGDRMKIGNWFESDFNLENAALVTEMAGACGVNWAVIESTLKTFRGVPGRMEIVATNHPALAHAKHKFSVIIDYAHTPESLEGLYRFIGSKLIAKQGGGRMICVLGSAGGGRDKWKRPQMGAVADRYCDEIVLTDEDPYDEDPVVIMKDVAAGISVKPYRIIEGRRAAIRRAMELAETGDAVVLTGKGSELWLHQEGGKKIPWSERKIVEECLVEMGLR
jgi:UDP-N-acetylmuramoyl-L-alanyl-D-glutamate--2,6-diaminopimelate ligase